jgi:YHS domain-containing protein
MLAHRHNAPKKGFTFVKTIADIETGATLNHMMMRDPVCGMSVDERNTKLVSERGGKKFYFCSPACRAAFDKDPEKFLSKL